MTYSIYEKDADHGDPYDLIIKKLRRFHPFRQGVEYSASELPTDVGAAGEGAGAAGAAGEGAGAAGAAGEGAGAAGAAGEPIAGPPTETVETAPGSTTKTNSDGSETVTKPTGETETVPALSREKPVSETTDNSPNNETPPEKAERTGEKSSLLEKFQKGLMLLPFLLPLALLLASFIQGEIACNQINGGGISGHGAQVMNVTNVVSAQWPKGLPSWVPTMNANKVDVTYSPCIQILSKDMLTFKDEANVFSTSAYPVSSAPGPCIVRIDLGKAYTANTVSNTATFTDKTSCSDRMAYAAGQDAGTVLQLSGDLGSQLLGGLSSSIPWSTIFLILALILAIYIAWQAIKIFTGP